jgi:hypothetical protein
LFRFEGLETATRIDLVLAWSPLVLLDVAVVEYVLGLVLWYSGKNNSWRTVLMSAQTVVLLLYSICMALWMWHSMSGKGGLGREEIQAAAERKRVADN